MSSAAQIRAIQSLLRRVGLTEEAEYRGFLQRHGGGTSAKTLSSLGAGRVIEALKQLPGAETRPAGPRGAAETATGPFAPILKALWLSAWNLGLVRSETDGAMMAWVKRQTKVDHTRFLVDGPLAAKAIDGLKDWIARDGGVAWPKGQDAIARRFAVAKAVAARLQEAGGFAPLVRGTSAWPDDIAAYGYGRGLPAGFTDYSAQDWDDLITMLGRRLRATLAEAARVAARTGETA